MIKMIFAGAVASCVTAAPLMAGSGPVAYRASDQNPRVYVVTRPIVEPAATVSRALSEQPVRPFMIEVKIVNTTTFLDPLTDLQYQGVGKIDDDHSLLKAQRLGRAMMSSGVMTYRGRAVEPALAGGAPTPSMILMKPGMLKSDPNNPMPIVPEKPDPKKEDAKKDGKLAAR